MATVLLPPGQVKKMLLERIQAGQDVAAKEDVAERTGGYSDWLQMLARWREQTVVQLKTAYEESDKPRMFGLLTEPTERSSPRFTFEYGKTKATDGIQYLERLIEQLPMAHAQAEDPSAIKSLHPEIYSKCRSLYEGGDFGEAVEKGFKIVRDRLRSLTTYETGTEAFGKGKLYVDGAAAAHVDDDFQNGVKFLTMAIDRFRNEKSHTADGNINDPVRAYEYLRLSSLAMHLLDSAKIP
jgi:uncharacterized protein (TIGR02391 family)